jgi:hypothetical protein
VGAKGRSGQRRKRSLALDRANVTERSQASQACTLSSGASACFLDRRLGAVSYANHLYLNRTPRRYERFGLT